MAGAAVAGVMLWLGVEWAAAWCAGVTVWTATWWITEAVPIPAASLVPFFAFPLLGVTGASTVAAALGDDLILLFMGGFMLSRAMEKSGAHHRLAIGMMRAVGAHGARRIVLGFMVAAAVLSMWISNTATALMMLPVALAVLDQTDEPRMAMPLLLSIAYATSIGGVGTPIGTPPNLVFIKNYELATGVRIGFLQWMLIGVPMVLALLPLAWLYLTHPLRGVDVQVTLPRSGPWRKAEARVLIIFAVTALLWVTRGTPGGGWSGLIGAPAASDGSVAMLAVVALFVVSDGQGGRLLDWPTALKIPWGILLLFAGGIAIAAAFTESGLAALIGQSIAPLAYWPLLALLATLCLIVTFLTEVTSNTATANLLMPLLAAAAAVAQIDPALLMVPATIATTCAFMLPVGTPPNAIVFATGRFSMAAMARRGLGMNFIAIAVITTLCYLGLSFWITLL
jgi:sodium-dependent dicarboxylate transporter 2/3/5